MKPSATMPVRPPSSQLGFSLVELVLSMAVLLIITTLAVPVILRSIQSYQLNSTASQLSGMLKFTKFEAIRQNTPVSCQIKQQGTNWIVWVDTNGDGTPNNNEPQMIVGAGNTLLPSGSVPSPNSIKITLGAASTLPWMVLSGVDSEETFDHRGVLDFADLTPPNPTVYALYFGNPNDPKAGYRAVVTLPSGAVQVWSAAAGGPWQRVS
jgi:prepilin-type N-terminal cleavage/methylation domain-containing protein